MGGDNYVYMLSRYGHDMGVHASRSTFSSVDVTGGGFSASNSDTPSATHSSVCVLIKCSRSTRAKPSVR